MVDAAQGASVKIRILIALCLVLCADIRLHAQDSSRREFFDAGLVLETGVRTGACDVLLFTPDGKNLLATGDDKVVRVWDWEKGKLDTIGSRALRWPVY